MEPIIAANEPTKEEQLADAARREYTTGLRNLADFYDANPLIPIPSDPITNYAVNTDQDARNLAKALGTFRKTYSEDIFTMSKDFGSVNVRFVFYRKAICKAKVVGVKTVEAVHVPAQEAYIIPAKTQEIIEWDCGALLGEKSNPEANDPAPDA
jgi:hypothetical protein